MYYSLPPMSATDKAPEVEEDDDTSIQVMGSLHGKQKFSYREHGRNQDLI